jgi:hypothetical protein
LLFRFQGLYFALSGGAHSFSRLYGSSKSVAHPNFANLVDPGGRACLGPQNMIKTMSDRA